MNVGLIILAAGASERLGEPKQLLKFEGKTFLRRAAETALASACRPVVVVLGANAENLANEIADLPLEIVINEKWRDGMSASIRAGMEKYLELEAQANAVVLMLCDQPLISAEIINQLIEVQQQTRKIIVASEYNNSFGVPALFTRAAFGELLNLQGEAGAKAVIKKHAASNIASVLISEAAFDIDTQADYQKLISKSNL